MGMKAAFMAIILGVGVLAAACGGGATSTPSPTATPEPTATATPVPTAAAPTDTPSPTDTPPPAATTHGIDITDNFTLSLPQSTILVGDTVKWTVTGVGHTTTSGQPGGPSDMWDSGFLGVGKSFSFTFSETGEFPYFCTLHPSILGKVTVVGSLAEVSAAPPPAKSTPGSGSYNY